MKKFIVFLLVIGIAIFSFLVYKAKWSAENLSVNIVSDEFALPSPPETGVWMSVSKNIDRKSYFVTKADFSVEFIAFKIKTDNVSMALHNQTEPMLMDQWQEQLDATILINGGYFDENNNPTGLLIIDGEEISSTRYDLDRSGALVITNTIDIIDTSADPLPEITDHVSILQSYPLLIKPGGKPGIKEDSQKLARRTVIGKDKNNNLIIIIVDQTPVSLYQLMQLLIESDLNVDIALNLDGGPSTAAIVNSDAFEESFLSFTLLPQVISIED